MLDETEPRANDEFAAIFLPTASDVRVSRASGQVEYIVALSLLKPSVLPSGFVACLRFSDVVFSCSRYSSYQDMVLRFVLKTQI